MSLKRVLTPSRSSKIFQLAALASLFECSQAYISGSIRTNEPFRYGKFRTRMQGQGEKGTVTSFFLYWKGFDQPWRYSEWEEIDIELVPSVEETPFFTNLIYRNKQMDGEYLQGFDPGNDWHEYEMVWTPEYIAWSVNGAEIRRRTGTFSVTDMDKVQHLHMNFWTPTWDGWGGGRDDSTMPWYARYDYVEAWDYDVNTQQFTLRFRDDFNTFDGSIWSKTGGGFESNSSSFDVRHTYIENGNLVLKMDKYVNPPQPQPDPAPEPIQPDPECFDVQLDSDAFEYGDACDGRHDQSLCGSGCAHCHKSWPALDPNRWLSDEAVCRCLPAQESAASYSYGQRSANSKAGLCGPNCSECRWSWPSSDDLKWKSDHLMPRCMPDGVEPYEYQYDQYENWSPDPNITYGGDCENLYDQLCGSNCTSCKWSWPTGDWRTWESDQARCRCDEKKTMIWGDSCASLTSGLCGDFCTDCRQATLLDGSGATTCRCKAW